MVNRYADPNDTTKVRGERHHNHKLTEEKARAILRRRPPKLKRPMKETSAEVAEEFGVNPATVLDIWHRRTWKHL